MVVVGEGREGEGQASTHKKWLGKGASTISCEDDWCATGIEDTISSILEEDETVREQVWQVRR